MYKFEIQPQNYNDPWSYSFEERLKLLAKGHRRVAYYYENPDNSTFRYRVYNMIQVLQVMKDGTSATYFTQNELDYLEKVVDIADVLVICRARYNDKLNRAINKARCKNKMVFFDIDDLIFDPAYIHLILDTLDQDLSNPNVWDFWFAYVGRLGMTMKLCDEIITTNEYLASHIREFADKPVSIIPNFLNQEQIEISNRIYREKRSKGFERTNQIHLGYFSGTPTHNKDFDVVADSLAKLLQIDSRIVLRVVGFMDLKGQLQNYQSRIEIIPLCDFVNLQRLIGEVEINLIPLQDNEFTNCKSDLKYFEASAVGTISVASPTYIYSKSIIDNENGFLAKSYEWYEKLLTLLDKIDVFPEIIERAYIDCEQRYAWYKQISLVEHILFPEKNEPYSQEEHHCGHTKLNEYKTI